MTLQTVSILLVLAGTALLISSLYPVRTICRNDDEHRAGWHTLFCLIHFFVVGYATYCFFLFRTTISLGDFVVALILFAGSIFVVIVVRMSGATIANVKRIAALERHNALHDDLTDLPNRTLLHEQIKQAILHAKRDFEPLAILVMDLDRFKEINDALGHHYGDFLLQKVAVRLQTVIRESDSLARLGGDEFAVVLPSVDVDQARIIANKIAQAIQMPFMIEGHSLTIGISIGIALYPTHGQESETLLQHADVAMYAAKSTESHAAIYDAAQDQYTLNRLMLLADLRETIRKEQLTLHYQPKIVLKNNRICGVEALVRWRHHDLDFIPPDHFIPLAEQGGLIRPLTLYVLECAVRQRAAWRDQGIDLTISVNLSIKDLQDLTLPLHVKKLLARWQLEPSDLMLEITESSMMLQPDRTFEVISNLHALGVQLSIDDFGTGYSSLSYLKQLPAEEIKIDKSFVINMIKDENDEVIVRATIDLAKNLGLKVIAEGWKAPR
ncbi:MAG: EAL domain-containing protein [Desulfobulbaceae bacterium]|nr:EAL domain-containing protein [Desulfobulbaceae bacterium]